MNQIKTTYKFKNGKWKKSHDRCIHCDVIVKGIHENCKTINTLKEKEMPIQVITIKGEKYYRWGDSGKPYKNRSDAERQAIAAHAAGYKEPKNITKQK